MEHRSRISFENTLGGWRRPPAPLFTKVPRKANPPRFAFIGFLEVGRLTQHRYGAYDPSPVVSSRTRLASSNNEPGTNTSLGPADRKSGASKPGARWISEGIPASFSTPSISSASVSSGAAATFTHLSTMYVSYPRLFTEARRRGGLRSSCIRTARNFGCIGFSEILQLFY